MNLPSKRRREDVLPLRPETAKALQQHMAAKLPAAPAFGLPKRWEMAQMMRADLTDARAAWLAEATTVEDQVDREKSGFLSYRDDAGRVADFHSLRHTFISNLAAAGVHPKLAQSLARHSDINLTLSRYTHTTRGEESEALAGLPDLTPVRREQHQATGTDGRVLVTLGTPSVLADCLAEKLSDQSNSVQPDAVKLAPRPATETINIVRENEQNLDIYRATTAIRLGRFELPTYGLGNRLSKSERPDPQKTSGVCDSVLADCLALLAPTRPELATVVDAWPGLPDAIKVGILAMVRVAR